MDSPWSFPVCRPHVVGEELQWRVWAPMVKQVKLVLYETDTHRVIRLKPETDGYHAIKTPLLPDGTRYAYRLDGGPERPDPCSLWQPDGVHRPSGLFLPDAFAWSDSSWRGVPRSDLVLYEMHVGTFTPEGTFDAAIERFASLRDLGVTAIEVLPVAQFPGSRNWGYDGVHLFAPQHSYGGPHGLQRFVDAAHAHGLAVILDVVYNHFGPEGNYIGEFGPYYSHRYNTPWGPAFNFDDRHSDAVRCFVLDNVRYWQEAFHIDGLRLDAVHAMFDGSPRHILREVKEIADHTAARQGRPTFICVESLLNDVRMLLPPERGGYGVDAEWNEDFHHAVIAYLTGERHGKYIDFGPVEHLPSVLNETFHLSGKFSAFRGRRWGAPAGDLPGDRFVIGIQNHDHVGNRALGERLASLAAPNVQRLAASLMLLSPHLPLLFMGEEYGETNPFLFFCSFGDHGLIENVRRGRRRDYDLLGEVPDPQDEASFRKSKLDWSASTRQPGLGLRELYRFLLAARKKWPPLQDWSRRSARLIKSDNGGHVLELIRSASPALMVYLNLSDHPQPCPTTSGDDPLLFSSEWERFGGVRRTDQVVETLLPYECIAFGCFPT